MAKQKAMFNCLVYNEQRNKIRLVHINPRQWKEGGGLVGCDLSTGSIQQPNFRQMQLVD